MGTAFILRAQTPHDAKDEAELRNWLVKELGEEDQRILAEWVWDVHRDGVRYVDALAVIIRHGGPLPLDERKAFFGRLLEVAKRPHDIREAELDLLAWFNTHSKTAVAAVNQNGATQSAAQAEMNALIEKLEAKVHKMFPGCHRASVRGAIISSFTDTGGEFKFDAHRLVQALSSKQQPLAETAKASWSAP